MGQVIYVSVAQPTLDINVQACGNLYPVTVNTSSGISVAVQTSGLNVSVGIAGIQGPPGTPASGVGSLQEFTVNVPTGSDYLSGVHFPRAFTYQPAVNLSLEIPSGDSDMYLWAIQNKTPTGFDVRFSDTIMQTGVLLNVMAS